MSSGWLAFTWVAIFVVIGGVLAVWLYGRAQTLRARAAAEADNRLHDLIATQSSANTEVADSLNRLDERLAAIEALLRDVG